MSQEQVYRGDSSDALCEVVFETASVANVRASQLLLPLLTLSSGQ